MENPYINKVDFEEFKKRGFFVKKNYKFTNLIDSLGHIIIYSFLVILFFILFFIPLIISLQDNYKIQGHTVVGIVILYTVYVWIFPILNFFYSYFSSGISFITNNGFIEFGQFNGNRSYLFFIDDIINKNMTSGKGWTGGLIIGMIMTSIVAMFVIGQDLLPFTFIDNGTNFLVLILFNELIAVILLGIFLLSLIFILKIGRSIFQSFHPLYAFGNLGEKIQKLTPQIEEQSQKIQSEFQSDMNFSILSNGFDSLSATFSEIVALVIKLEKVETKANKGNLFDSEKYINSLRSDIVEPLQSLKEFLEVQRNKLFESQKELTRVRVGRSEESGNIELQSKRSESLIVELTENIEKLDVMIGKMWE